MGIKIEMLRCFVAVADCGSLAGAASKLHRSSAAVSLTLKQLENHLGKSLFESDRKTALSTVGRFVLELAREELVQFDTAIRSMERFARAETGLVRISSVPSVAGTILPVVLEHFQVSNPEVQIELFDKDSASVIRDMETHRADIGIATVTQSTALLHCIPLFADEYGLVCPAENPLGAVPTAMQWHELVGSTFIANSLCATISAADFRPFCEQARLTVHNIVSLLAMVKAGLGVTILPRTVLNLYPEELLFRPIADTEAVRQIHLLKSSSKKASPAADALQQTILSVISEAKRSSQ